MDPQNSPVLQNRTKRSAGVTYMVEWCLYLPNQTLRLYSISITASKALLRIWISSPIKVTTCRCSSTFFTFTMSQLITAWRCIQRGLLPMPRGLLMIAMYHSSAVCIYCHPRNLSTITYTCPEKFLPPLLLAAVSVDIGTRLMAVNTWPSSGLLWHITRSF